MSCARPRRMKTGLARRRIPSPASPAGGEGEGSGEFSKEHGGHGGSHQFLQLGVVCTTRFVSWGAKGSIVGPAVRAAISLYQNPSPEIRHPFTARVPTPW